MDDNMMDKVKQLLDDPDTMRTLTEMLGSMGSGMNGGMDGGQKSELPAQNGNDAARQMEIMAKMKTVMDRMNTGTDPRINLLTALKPYMREGRAEHMDKAIRMLQMTRMTSILKDLN